MAGAEIYRMACRFVVVLLLVTVSACTSIRPPMVLSTTFEPRAAAFIHEIGTAKISGQAFIRQNGGTLFRAVGTDIFLVPRTAYSDERIAAIYGDGKRPRAGIRMPKADLLYEQYMRKTIANSGGSFSFDRVADGEYYVIAMIFLPSDVLPMQVPIIDRVTVQNGRSVRLVMRGY